ncbi:MAG: 4-hydroxy-3-methylbut-2-enyl diphosphate reductase [Alphaproteobacteria bacterium]
MPAPTLAVKLVGPRGFCAGVVRAIEIVERAIERYGSPVFVRHEIVHNKFVVEDLKSKGAIFVSELDEVPDDARVIFSAHGVPKSVPKDAEARQLLYIDATCPLVSKVHREAERAFNKGRHVILIGHLGHPEVVGTMGQLPKGAVTLVETPEQATLLPNFNKPLTYCTQTTLSLDDTAATVAALISRFPDIEGPKAQDICYATTNRQEAVKAVAKYCDAFFVIGAPNSSNSNRLVEVAVRAGVSKSLLVERGTKLPWKLLEGVKTLGISAGASAPEILVEEVIHALKERYEVSLEVVEIKKEQVTFNLPRELR